MVNPPHDQSAHGASSTDNIKQLTNQIREVSDLLRSQQDALKQRGVVMTPDTTESLRTLRRRVDGLGKNVLDARSELSALRALADTAALINSSQKTDEVLNQVMDTVIALTGAERGYIVLKNQDTGELEFKVARGMEQSTLDSSDGGMIISKTVVNTVADSGKPVLTDNASQDERYQSNESIVGFGLRSILAVPLIVRDMVIGVVYCDNRFMSGLFKEQQKDVLTAFTAQAAVAIENARLFESLNQSIADVTTTRDHMNNLFTSIASGVITIDASDSILISNKTAEELLAQTAMTGKTLRDVLPAMPDAFWQMMAMVRQSYQQKRLELKVPLRGEERIWSITASPLRAEESAGGVALVFDDITAQKQGEEQLTEARRYLPAALVKNMGNLQISAVGSQEREITALFADVRGFTTFSENLEPEELMEVINQYLSLASDAIGFYEGIVDKYMGDAVTGLWNTQLNPQEDHAARGVQAALNIVLDLHAHHEVLPEDQRLFYGIGIHSGPAVLGNVGGQGRKEFAAFGEATNVCKFLQEQAGPGETVISEQTMRMVEDQFVFEEITQLARPSEAYKHIKCYKVMGRKKGALSAFVDEELLALLGDLNDD